MSSTTCNCVGLGRHDEKTHTRRMYVAQNRAEIMQMRHEAKQDGDAILVWYAQTPAGVRVLGPACPEENAHVMDSFVPSVPMVTCPYCHGRGRNGNHYCPVCRGSGLMKPGHDKRWQQWQLDSMKAEADEADGGTA